MFEFCDFLCGRCLMINLRDLARIAGQLAFVGPSHRFKSVVRAGNPRAVANLSENSVTFSEDGKQSRAIQVLCFEFLLISALLKTGECIPEPNLNPLKVHLGNTT